MDPFDLFWNLDQQRTPNDQEQALSRASSRSDDLAREVERLRDELAAMRAGCNALVQILVDKGVITSADVTVQAERTRAEMAQRFAKVRCPSCEREAVPRRGRCMYCGATVGGAR